MDTSQSLNSSSLISGFINSTKLFPENLALVVNDQEYTYNQLMGKTLALCDFLTQNKKSENDSLIGVITNRSLGSFVGILGTLYSGSGYVPIGPSSPIERIKKIILISKINILITDNENAQYLIENLCTLSRKISIVIIDDVNNNYQSTGSVDVFNLTLLEKDFSLNDLIEPRVSQQQIAYLIFTSGSTGEPKGVSITHQNISSFLMTMTNMYQMDSSDRFILLPDLTFDLSIFPLWVSWKVGGSLFCVPKKSCLAPGAFVLNHKITVWCSVPSTVTFMRQFGQLKPNLYPLIKLSIFCGEPFLKEQAEYWEVATPHSQLENLYGPTEVTVFSTSYTWNKTGLNDCPNGILTIGKPFKGLSITLVDESLQPVKNGETGEICITGPQLSPGYWLDLEKTANSYIQLNLSSHEGLNRWYRAGDLARVNENGDLLFMGRIDEQVKISGHRIELLEIENIIRSKNTNIEVAVIVHQASQAQPGIIVVYLSGKSIDIEKIKQDCKLALPDYMVPKEFKVIDQIPLNNNGKTDKNKLKELRRLNS